MRGNNVKIAGTKLVDCNVFLQTTVTFLFFWVGEKKNTGLMTWIRVFLTTQRDPCNNGFFF